MTDELYRTLTKHKLIELQLVSIRVDIEELQTHLLPSAIRYDKDAVQTSCAGDGVSKILATIADLESKYDKKCIDYNNAIVELSTILDQLDPQQSIVMKYKYIKQMRASEIAEELSYSEQNIFRLNRIAIRNLEDIIKNKVK